MKTSTILLILAVAVMGNLAKADATAEMERVKLDTSKERLANDLIELCKGKYIEGTFDFDGQAASLRCEANVMAVIRIPDRNLDLHAYCSRNRCTTL